MSDASFASLGPTLLARKGGAKPAMRPQLGPLPEMVADEQLEDLGWNDMGQDEDDQEQGQTAEIVSINPSVKREVASQDNSEDAAPTKLNSAKKGTGKESNPARRAAFTLRLDTDRHLKLRLAATMQGISAQVLVTQALDATLSKIDDLDALVIRMKRT